jgi:deoxyadenosine/deoxycytidine kinase
VIPEPFRFIAIEGPIGVGKTTLARRLADELGADLLLEKPADNPFLPRFYQDPQRYALPTQLTFLFERVDQFRSAAQGRLFQQRLVSDFVFQKDALFAKLTLSNTEYGFYTKVFHYLNPEVPRPDCVIYLRAPVELLLERIALRGREMERGIEADYLQRLCDEYAQFFDRYDDAPVLTVDTEAFNPASRAAHFALLLDALQLLPDARHLVLTPEAEAI